MRLLFTRLDRLCSSTAIFPRNHQTAIQRSARVSPPPLPFTHRMHQLNPRRPKPMIHRRAYSLNHSSPILRLPLPKRTSNFNTTPLNLPSISELDLPARTPSRTPSPIPSRAITPPLQKRTIQVDPSLAAHLKKGGVVFLKSKDGRRLRVCLPPRMMGV